MCSENLFLLQKSLRAILIFAVTYCVVACADAEKSQISEAMKHTVLMSKLQAYRRTHGVGKFSDNFKDLHKNITEETNSYSYSIKVFGTDWVQNIATPKFDGLESYVGIVHSYKDNTNQLKAMSIICMSVRPTKLISRDIIKPTVGKHSLSCPDGYIEKYRMDEGV
jgi:Type IV pilin-like G and H, putative